MWMRAPMRLTLPRRRIRPSRRLLPLRKTRLALTAATTTTTTTKTRKTTTPFTLGQKGSRDVRNVRRSHYYPGIATMTTMTMTTMNITLNQAMTRVRRRRDQEGTPRVPYGPPRKLTGQATQCPLRKRRRQFRLRLVRTPTSPDSWWPMDWMKLLRSNNWHERRFLCMRRIAGRTCRGLTLSAPVSSFTSRRPHSR